MQVREFERFALEQAGAPPELAQPALCAAIRSLWVEMARRHGCAEPAALIDAVLGLDLQLNADGLLAWLARRRP
jgi:hypothetical protein